MAPSGLPVCVNMNHWCRSSKISLRFVRGDHSYAGVQSTFAHSQLKHKQSPRPAFLEKKKKQKKKTKKTNNRCRGKGTISSDPDTWSHIPANTLSCTNRVINDIGAGLISGSWETSVLCSRWQGLPSTVKPGPDRYCNCHVLLSLKDSFKDWHFFSYRKTKNPCCSFAPTIADNKPDQRKALIPGNTEFLNHEGQVLWLLS